MTIGARRYPGRFDVVSPSPRRVGVPGALAAYQLAIEKAGRRRFADLLLPAAELADRGIAIDRVFAGNLRSKAEVLRRFEGSRSVLLKPDGQPYQEGEIVRQADLAGTYRAIAKEGIDWFYRGPFAQAVAHGRSRRWRRPLLS